MNMILNLKMAIILMITLSTNLMAAEQRFEMAKPSEANSNQIKFNLGYALGTHVGKAYDGEGYVKMESGHLETIQGEFHIPIAAIRTGGDATRDCHLRESLGLNYELAGYPGVHLCDSSDKIPESGNGSIMYPYVNFVIDRVALISTESEIEKFKLANISLFGTWEIHGKKFSTAHLMQIELLPEGKGMVVKGDFYLKFDDFDIQVKPVRVIGFNIGTDKLVKVKLAILLNLINP